jgi:hypothetical protein
LTGECYPTCPPDYIKSYDGKVCEKRQYPLDQYYIPFPFLFLMLLFDLIIFASYIITKKVTLLWQNMIAANSLVLIFCTIFQVLAAILEGGQPLPIVSCFIILIANLIINFAYIGTFKW